MLKKIWDIFNRTQGFHDFVKRQIYFYFENSFVGHNASTPIHAGDKVTKLKVTGIRFTVFIYTLLEMKVITSHFLIALYIMHDVSVSRDIILKLFQNVVFGD